MKKIRVIRNLARSGGTIIGKCIGCMNGISLLSEVHPFAMHMFNPMFQAKTWFNLFNKEEIEKLSKLSYIGFKEAINIIYEKCEEKGLTLILREWNHLDFTGTPFLNKPEYNFIIDEILSDFKIIPVYTTRHPLDQWLSISRLQIMQGKLDLSEYLYGYRKFAQKICNKFYKYEDFTKNPKDILKKICVDLDIEFDSTYNNKWWNYTTITGDTVSERGYKKEIKTMPRRKIPEGLLKIIESNSDYKKILKILKY